MSNIQFVLDVSGSMSSTFGEGTRYDAAMSAITDFTTYRPGDAFGLTVFGVEVLHWVPLTKDLSAIRHATPFLAPDNWPAYMGGTMIGAALRECMNLLVSRPHGDRMMVLVTDGFSADLYGAAGQQIAAELAAEDIVVYIIIVGESLVPDEMNTIASLTGGELFNVGDPAALHTVFRRIDAMQQARLTPPGREYADFFLPLCVAGLTLATLHVLCGFGLRYTPW
jgi:Ca-activated chloride channel family protein